MCKVFWLFCVLFVRLTLSAQQPPILPEQLLAKAAVEKQDTSKLKLLMEAAAQLQEMGKREQLIQVLAQSREILKNTPFIVAQVDMYRVLSDFHGAGGNRELRNLYADSMIAVSRQQKYVHGEAKGLLAKGIAFAIDMNMEQAFIRVKQAIVLFETVGDNWGLAKCYKLNGNLFLQVNNGLGAVAQYRLAAGIFKKIGAINDEALVYANTARAFNALKLIDSAIYYNRLAMDLARQLPKGTQLHFMVNMSDAEFQSAKGNSEAARQSIIRAETIAKALQNTSMLGGVYVIRTNIAKDQQDYKTALDYSLLSNELHKKSGNFSLLMESYAEISNVYVKLGDYKNAYEYSSRYQDIYDSLFSAKTASEINELNVKYNTTEKEKQITGQQLVIANKNIRLRSLLFILAGAAMLIGVLILFYFQRRKNYNQSLITLKKEQDISLLKALMTGEEKERNRLARELHDGLGGILAAAQMQVSNLDINSDIVEQEKKQQAAGLIAQAAAESRRIAHNLLPETLLRYGLDEALKEYSKSITDSKLLRLDYESVGLENKLDEPAALSIYRIIQELINNIVKHAEATEALIQLHQSGNKLAITVEDNGKGFSPQQNGRNGIGLSNIKSRVSYLNGSLDIRSEAQKGTSVYIEIQLKK